MNKITKSYIVERCQDNNLIDADWDKSFWQNIETLEMANSHWPVQSEFLPFTEVKLQYNHQYLFAIFKVQDQYLNASANKTHDPVCQDSCVEFFFSPSAMPQTGYFNLELNCCGVLLMAYHIKPRDPGRYIELQDCQKLKIVSSLSNPIRSECKEPTTWTLEFALPFAILCHYTKCQRPAPGVCWAANFYKCADASSHPHWLSWSPINIKNPDFHRPDYFGNIIFA